MRDRELILFKDKEEEKLLSDMSWLMERYDDEAYTTDEKRFLMYECLHYLIDFAGNHGFHGNLWHCYLANLLVNNENTYSKGCEIRGAIEGSINEAALHDIAIFKEFYDFDLDVLKSALAVPELDLIKNYVPSDGESKVYNQRICKRICELAERFCNDETPQEMKDTLTDFYKEYGVGKFGLHKSFRVIHDESGVHIEPILNIAHVYLNDLVGYNII